MDKIVSLLLEHYPEGKCALSYRTPFELLVASRLSAQCTDVRVNIVTEALFAKYKTPQDFCDIPLETLERYIHSCGLFHTKAVDIKAMSERIVSVYESGILICNRNFPCYLTVSGRICRSNASCWLSHH